MRRRWKRLALSGFGLVACATLYSLMHPAEPSYGGRRLSEWVDLYGGHRALPNQIAGEFVFGTEVHIEDAPWAAARAALIAIGTNAFPFLLTWIDYEPPGWQIKLASLSHRLPECISNTRAVRSLLETGVPRARADNAAECFVGMGPRALSILPELGRFVQQTNSPETSIHAIRVLSTFGKSGEPALRTALRHPNPAIRGAAEDALVLLDSDDHLTNPTQP